MTLSGRPHGIAAHRPRASECGGLDGNTCAGSNKCAGKGWIKVSADECTAKKGHPLGS